MFYCNDTAAGCPTDTRQFLKEVRAELDPKPRDVFDLNQVDRLLELFRYHATTSAAETDTNVLQSTVRQQGDDEDVYNPTLLTRSTRLWHRPPVVEITSIHSAAGRTSLLYYLTALALLHKDDGGKASAVIWLDTDGRFSALRLSQVLTAIIAKNRANTAHPTEPLIHQALTHLHILHPQSSSQLVSMLQQLPSYLLSPSSHQSSTRRLDLIVLDSSTTFTFQDRFEADIARLEAGTTSDPTTTLSRPAQIQEALRNLQSKFDCSILFTTDGAAFPHTMRTQPTEVPREATSISSWTAFATLSVTVQRAAVPQFAPNMSLDQCLADRAQRQEAMSKSRFVVGLDWKSSERWAPHVRKAASELPGRGVFGMRIKDHGVEIE